MTGSLLQLVAVGNEDIFITGNPQITFFKTVYKQHNNFSIENADIPFAYADKRLSFNDYTRIYANIPKDGDIMSNMFLKINLPAIYATNTKFRWIHDIGTTIISYAKLFIDGNLIEELKGDYITAYFRMMYSDAKREIINEMTGNTPEMYNPFNNVENEYPYHTSNVDSKYYNTIPTIKEKTLVIPLPFWFTKSPGTALPLSIIDRDVRIEIELRPVKHLYTVDREVSNADQTSVKSVTVRPDTLSEEIENFLGNNTWIPDPKLEVEYIFIDKLENDILKNKVQTYLVEIVNYKEFLGRVDNVNIEVELFHPTKDIIVLLRRDDVIERNQYSNYTNFDSVTDRDYNLQTNNENMWKHREFNQIPTINLDNQQYFTENIMNNLEIHFNGDARIDERSYNYFNKVQPYMHYNNSSPGIVTYSFSIYPSKYQPSGACNFTEITRVQFLLNLKNPLVNESSNKNGYRYDIMVFTNTYNILKIEDGLCNLVYSS